MHLKMFLCLFSFAVLLGIITVTPCARGEKNSLIGRSYGLDTCRANELCEEGKNLVCKLMKK